MRVSRRLRWAGTVVLAILAASSTVRAEGSGADAREGTSVQRERRDAAAAGVKGWTTLATGLEMRHIAAEGESASLRLVRVPRQGFRVRVVHGKDLFAARYAPEPGVVAALNANFFDKEGKALGWVVADGREVSPVGRSGWGVLRVLVDGRPEILRAAAVRAVPSTRQAVQAGPLLVVSGAPNRKLKRQRARRSFVGIDGEGRLVLGSTGLESFEARRLARLLAAPESEGGAELEWALNLDGGSSAQAFVRGGGADGADWIAPSFIAVPVLLVVERR